MSKQQSEQLPHSARINIILTKLDKGEYLDIGGVSAAHQDINKVIKAKVEAQLAERERLARIDELGKIAHPLRAVSYDTIVYLKERVDQLSTIPNTEGETK
jgi:hypothetical protein